MAQLNALAQKFNSLVVISYSSRKVYNWAVNMRRAQAEDGPLVMANVQQNTYPKSGDPVDCALFSFLVILCCMEQSTGGQLATSLNASDCLIIEVRLNLQPGAFDAS